MDIKIKKKKKAYKHYYTKIDYTNINSKYEDATFCFGQYIFLKCLSLLMGYIIYVTASNRDFLSVNRNSISTLK